MRLSYVDAISAKNRPAGSCCSEGRWPKMRGTHPRCSEHWNTLHARGQLTERIIWSNATER